MCFTVFDNIAWFTTRLMQTFAMCGYFVKLSGYLHVSCSDLSVPLDTQYISMPRYQSGRFHDCPISIRLAGGSAWMDSKGTNESVLQICAFTGPTPVSDRVPRI